MDTNTDPAMALFTDNGELPITHRGDTIDFRTDDEMQEDETKDEKKLDEKTAGNKEQDNLNPDHPRFQKIYGKMKGFERSLTDRDAQIKDLIEHNNKLADAIGNLDSKLTTTKRPDPAEEPELYEEWLTEKIVKQMKPTAKRPAQTTAQPASDQRLIMQENAMAAVYDDFYEVLGIVGEEMKSNEMLREEIMTHQNPPKKLYTYYQNKVKRNQDNNDDVSERSQTESGGFGAKSNSKGRLSADQKKMATNLGLSVDVYSKQLDFINQRR